MENAILSATIEDDLSSRTLGQRVADKVAIFGGVDFLKYSLGCLFLSVSVCFG
jgi:uncharacterized membrane protein